MKKNLFTVCILVLAMQAILGESYMTEEVFTVGEGAEVKVTILYESGSFEVNLTISNTSENIIVLHDRYFRTRRSIGFQNSLGEKAAFYSPTSIRYLSYAVFEDLLFLEPNESAYYLWSFKYYLDDDSQEIVITDGYNEMRLNKGDQIYCVIYYSLVDYTIENMKALTDEYILELFEKRHLLELEF